MSLIWACLNVLNFLIITCKCNIKRDAFSRQKTIDKSELKPVRELKFSIKETLVANIRSTYEY